MENIDGWEQFSLCHPFLCEMCEVIIYSDITGNYVMFSDNWSAEDKRNALAHLKILELFEFIYALTTLQHSLLYLKEAAVKLQGTSQNIVSGFLVVEQCTTELKMLRENVDGYTGRIFQHSSRIAGKAEIPVTMPRIIQGQQHCSNPEYSSAQEYYKCTVVISFLDHLITELSSRFEAHVKQAASLQSLLPAMIKPCSSITYIEQAISFYADHLPNVDIVDEEFHVWKSRWLAIPVLDRPKTLACAMKQCSPQSLPNIFTLLKPPTTLLLSSCSCERSASALRRLNTYLRCTQTQDRLSALALIHCNYDTEIDVDSVCKLFIENIPEDLSVQIFYFSK